LPEARVDHPLPLLGGMVLRIFAQVAMRPGFGDFSRELNSQFVFEQCDLIFQLLYKILHFEAFYIIGVENGNWAAIRRGFESARHE
jgi:hypothetical protein